ncbi:hypothetical protein CGRA01v4_04059 [Colletotrichum graminicola]|nr:hypothetical protein CGRA01v4_04059 [Colletotrichum graminicola]
MQPGLHPSSPSLTTRATRKPTNHLRPFYLSICLILPNPFQQQSYTGAKTHTRIQTEHFGNSTLT